MNKLTVFVYLCVITINCNNINPSKNENQIDLRSSDSSFIVLDKSNTLSSVESLKSYYSIQENTFLSTSEKTVIPHIDRLHIGEKRYYISDKENVYIFNHKGDFLLKINSVGKGPKEFLSIFDFDVDESAKAIFLLVRTSFSKNSFIYKYDLEGNFVNFHDLGFYANKLIFKNDYLYLYSDFSNVDKHQNFNLNILSSNTFENLKKGFKFDYRNKPDGAIEHETFFNSTNGIWFSQNISNELHHFNGLSNDTYIEFVYVGSDNIRKIQSRYKVDPISTFISNYEEDLKMNPTIILATDSLLFYSYALENGTEMFLISSIENNTFIRMNSRINIQEFMQFQLVFEPDYYKEGYYYKLMDIFEFQENLKLILEINPGYELNRLEKDILDHDIQSNPIILKYKIKLDPKNIAIPSGVH